ncbi:MAG: hypothetical protein ACRERU_12475 [Methylococcales bacterium]
MPKIEWLMFDDNFFENWLDTQAQKVMEQVGNNQPISSEQITILILKAQTNHFHHLDVELKSEIQSLRVDMDGRFEQVDKRFEQMQAESAKRFEQVDKRFEQMQAESAKRFEQVDKRFEQVDKRFEQLTSRIDHFMIWSFATTVSVGGMIVAAIKFL